MFEFLRTGPFILLLIILIFVLPLGSLIYAMYKRNQPRKGMRVRIKQSNKTGLTTPISEEEFVGLLATVEARYLDTDFWWVKLDEQPDLDLALHKYEMERVK
jgi:hypothetical protein